jgi:hypothetical protein
MEILGAAAKGKRWMKFEKTLTHSSKKMKMKMKIKDEEWEW